jgi:hypothetical protein
MAEQAWASYTTGLALYNGAYAGISGDENAIYTTTQKLDRVLPQGSKYQIVLWRTLPRQETLNSTILLGFDATCDVWAWIESVAGKGTLDGYDIVKAVNNVLYVLSEMDEDCTQKLWARNCKTKLPLFMVNQRIPTPFEYFDYDPAVNEWVVADGKDPLTFVRTSRNYLDRLSTTTEAYRGRGEGKAVIELPRRDGCRVWPFYIWVQWFRRYRQNRNVSIRQIAPLLQGRKGRPTWDDIV